MSKHILFDLVMSRSNCKLLEQPHSFHGNFTGPKSFKRKMKEQKYFLFIRGAPVVPYTYLITQYQGSSKRGPVGLLPQYLFSQIKFDWNTAAHAFKQCPCCFHAKGRSVIISETAWPAKLKLFTVWPTSAPYCNGLTDASKASIY